MSTPLRRRDFALTLLLVATSWALAAWLYGRLPERVPVHWNAMGEADGWGSRGFGTFLLPVVVTGMALLFAFLPALDPRGKDHYATFRGAWLALSNGILVFLVAVQGTIGAQQLDPQRDLSRLLPVLLALLFAGIGFLLPRFEPNWFAGIRTPWTLEDDRVWRDTHRVGGRMFVVAGVVAVLCALFAPKGWAMLAPVGAVMVAALGSVAYSWRRWKQLHAG